MDIAASKEVSHRRLIALSGNEIYPHKKMKRLLASSLIIFLTTPSSATSKPLDAPLQDWWNQAPKEAMVLQRTDDEYTGRKSALVSGLALCRETRNLSTTLQIRVQVHRTPTNKALQRLYNKRSNHDYIVISALPKTTGETADVLADKTPKRYPAQYFEGDSSIGAMAGVAWVPTGPDVERMARAQVIRWRIGLVECLMPALPDGLRTLLKSF